jgi:membrane protease YdiL (CAAX protease family)
VILYVITGTLWVPIVVHTFFDLNSGLLAYAFLRPDRNQPSLDTP